MTERSIVHASFRIERTYDAPPKRVFNAFADKEAKALWFGAPEDGVQKTSMDFRVGGREHSSGKIPNGPAYTFDALYQDIIANERIVYTYDMTIDGKRISVSLATIEFRPAGKGTRLVLSEQGAFLDGLDNPDLREAGTKDLLDKLGASLKKAG
jgi:uncharacterized protein YndB with AHSA1/START domain